MPLDVNIFAGAGGMALGLREAGFQVDLLYEIDPEGYRTLRQNKIVTTDAPDWDQHRGDVRKVDWSAIKKPVRLLAGGVPCQPFSLAGKHLAERDGRNLFPEFLRAVRALRPSALLIENVYGILRKSFAPYFQYILHQLETPSLEPQKGERWEDHAKRLEQHRKSKGFRPEYRVVDALLNAADYGVPQIRKRLFIVATKNGLPRYRFPPASHSRHALIYAQAQPEYWEARGMHPRQAADDLLLDAFSDDGTLPWVTVRDAISTLPPPASSESEAQMNHWRIPGARAYRGHNGSPMDWPSKAIKAGVHGVPGGENTVRGDDGEIRYYTLREAARIQSFPDTHVFHGSRRAITRQIGNAVPCRLVSVVARSLLPLLTRTRKSPRGNHAEHG